jgi:hypothetical protein
MMSIFQHLLGGASISAAAGRVPKVCPVAPCPSLACFCPNPNIPHPRAAVCCRTAEGRLREPPSAGSSSSAAPPPPTSRSSNASSSAVPEVRGRSTSPSCSLRWSAPSPSILTSNPHHLLLPVLYLLPHHRKTERHLFRRRLPCHVKNNLPLTKI